jgi:hypothetical protein
MSVPTLALIPALGYIFEGLMWDITEKQNDNVSSDVSVEPIEDPNRAYLVDFNQDKPAELSLTIIVSANSCGTAAGTVGNALGQAGEFLSLGKIALVHKLLLDLKRKQTTRPDALIDVFTGSYFWRNMAITNVSSSRDARTPNVQIFDIDLMQFNFAKAPEVPNAKAPLAASTGATSAANQTLTSQFDRFILEATKQLNNPQIISYAGQALSFLRGGLGV